MVSFDLVLFWMDAWAARLRNTNKSDNFIKDVDEVFDDGDEPLESHHSQHQCLIFVLEIDCLNGAAI